jgi:hypothetical protein
VTRCIVCSSAIEGASIRDPDSGIELHAACLADRLPGDVAVTAVGTLALLLAPLIVVWAG